jgi:hypothetical protein
MEVFLKLLLGLLGILMLVANENLREKNQKRGLNYYQKLIGLYLKTLLRAYNQIVRPRIYHKYSEGYLLPAKFIYAPKFHSKTQS